VSNLKKFKRLSNGGLTVINTNATNLDLQKSLVSAYPAAVAQMYKSGFYKTLQGATVKETAANIWHFLKNNITYEKDVDGYQFLMLPARFAKRAKGDCKNYSLFTASVLGAMGLPVFFDFTNYSSKTGVNPYPANMPTHVYCSTLDEQGKRIIIDGVYNKFNKEKDYYFKIIQPMKIAVLSGFGEPKTLQIERNQITDPVKRQQYKARVIQGEINRLLRSKDPVKRAKGNALLNSIQPAANVAGIYGKKGKKKKGAGFKKVTLVGLRNAYLLLVKLNVRGTAHKLSILISKPGGKDKLKNVWVNKLGGKFDVLLKNIETGKKKKPLLGESKKTKNLSGLYDYTVGGGLGVVETITLGSVLAAAAGAIAAISPLLKNININKDGGEATSANDIAPGSSSMDLLQDSTNNGGDPAAPLPPAGAGSIMDQKLFGLPLPLVILGGAGAVYLATKK